MKRLFAAVLIFIMTLLAFGCGKKEETKGPVQTAEVSVNTEIPAETIVPEETKEVAQIEAAIPKDMETMVYPIDSFIRWMITKECEFSPNDDEIFWGALYYVLGEYGNESPLVEVSDETLKVPRKVAQEYATALFTGYSDLPELPADMKDWVQYDESWDAYIIKRGDRGDAEVKLSDYKELADGSYQVKARFVSSEFGEEEVLANYEVTLKKNSFADGIEDPLFLYSIDNIVGMDSDVPSENILTGSFSGLSDGHTVELIIEDGEVSTFQFYDEKVADKLNTLEPGEEITFQYKEEGDSITIVAIH